MTEIDGKLVYDYADDKNMLYPIPKYVKAYLRRFKMIDTSDLKYVGNFKRNGLKCYKPLYLYGDKHLDIEKKDYFGNYKRWCLKLKGFPLAIISPGRITIKRLEPSTGTKQIWNIDTTETVNSISIRCTLCDRIDFQICVVKNDITENNAGFFNILLNYEDSHGTRRISLQQPLDDVFYEPYCYQNYLASRINQIIFDENDSDQHFVRQLLNDIIHDSRIEIKLKELLPGDLLESSNLESEDRILIKSIFNKKSTIGE